MTSMARTTKNSRNDAEKAVREMERDFAKRIDTIMAELKEKGPEAAASAERSLGELKVGFEDRLNDVRESIDNARESLDDAVETGRSTIQERPLMAVGVALAAGVVIGLIFGRKSKN